MAIDRPLLTLLLAAAFLAQIAFGYLHRDLKVEEPIMPPAPTPAALRAMAFGDAQFLYRQLVLDVQNFGDTGGRITRMTDYPIEDVLAWLHTLDALDGDAAHHMLLALRYFAQTKDTDAVRQLVLYVGDKADQNPQRHSVWLSDAIYLAEERLGDPVLALRLGDVIAKHDPANIPVIIRQLPAFLHEKAGDFAGAAAIMKRVQNSRPTVSEDEKLFMENYIRQMMIWAENPPPPESRRLLPRRPRD